MTATLKTWTGSTGTRRYISNLLDILGVEIDYYRTGNIRSALLGGLGISNAEAGRIKGISAWLDEAGELHISNNNSRDLSTDNIETAVRAALKDDES